MAYRRVMSDADRVLGIYATRSGSLTEEFYQKYAESFYEFIASYHSILPDIIQYEGASYQSHRIETNLGPITHQARSETLYLFPKNGVILHLNPFYAPPKGVESKYIPGSKDFMGIEALIAQEKLPAGDLVKLKPIYKLTYSSGTTIEKPNTHDWRWV